MLLVWLLGGAIALMGASCFAELATALPRAGGPYVYTRRAFGDFTGFATGWSDWVVNTCALAFLSVAVGEYAAQLLPKLAGYEHVLAVGLLVLLGAINWFGLQLGARLQEVLSLAKILALLAIAIGCLLVASPDAALISPERGLVAPVVFAVLPFIVAMQAVTETYAGWNSSVYFAEEDKDTPHNAPRALFWGVIAVTVTYVAVNLSLLLALPYDTLASSKLPVADAAGAIFGGASHRVVTAIALVSLIGAVNVYVILNPRIVFAMSRDGLLPAIGSRLNDAATPGMGIVISVVPAAVLAAGLSFEILFAMAAFLSVAVNASSYLAYFQLRRTEPDLPRPYRAWGHPVLPALVTLISLALLAGFTIANPEPSIYALALCAASYPVYRWLRRAVPQPRGT